MLLPGVGRFQSRELTAVRSGKSGDESAGIVGVPHMWHVVKLWGGRAIRADTLGGSPTRGQKHREHDREVEDAQASITEHCP